MVRAEGISAVWAIKLITVKDLDTSLSNDCKGATKVLPNQVRSRMGATSASSKPLPT